ncbi:hypothetical protein TEA_002969 [Camellia sinensis var. sinensis]|uniref:1-acylglycerol-3-phosphate O-acyltransferase n=1 Tax=Camellia sinensis var. sinensis TaxID=542762 RepID=A0A4S4DAH0_CAMSN|nr:hypothetical protein TEA_002969 [Camellia sinensis var. sinensis]
MSFFLSRLAWAARFHFDFDSAGLRLRLRLHRYASPSSSSSSSSSPPLLMHVHLKRHLMKDLPETDDAVAQWCRDMFVAKDKLLDKHIAEDIFSEQEQDMGRPIKSLVVIISWGCLLIFGALKFFQWTSLLSTWKGMTFSAIGLAIVTVLMQILIQFSQSERSTPAKVTPVKPKNGGEPSRTGQDKHK